jgi:hypothetical protein
VGQFTTNQATTAVLGALAVPAALFSVSLPVLVLGRRRAEGVGESRDERPPRDRTPHVLGRVTVGQRKIRHALPPFSPTQAEWLP